MRFLRSALSLAALSVFGPAVAADIEPVYLEPVQVTATKEPEPVSSIPASMTIVSGEEMRARGANDLRTALALVAGVEGTPGGDSGGAGSVPAIWGLREADAFLLVVDGVPWGGAFNPATPSIDLNGVERIEVLRGAAPVMFGATSFNGVIHVIHYAAGKAPGEATITGGSPNTYGVSISSSLPSIAGWKQSAGATVERRGYRVDRQKFERYNGFYRGATEIGTGRFHLDLDLTSIPQKPGNVIFRNGPKLRTDILPVNANHNPSDAKLDQQRGHLAMGYDLPTSFGEWSTTLAFTRTVDDITRGFLRDYAPQTGAEAGDQAKPDDFDADGYLQKRQITDVYFDTHIDILAKPTLNFVVGADYLYGKGKQNFNAIGYYIGLDGRNAPSASAQHVDEIGRSEDQRNFAGLYTQVDWKALPSVDVLAGLRLNHTHETARGVAIANDMDQMQVQFDGNGGKSKTRVSGTAGVAWHVLQQGRDSVTLYTDYRNTYKPKSIDFGPEAEVAIQEPETANSYEAGVKGALFAGRYEYDISVFRLDFKNLLSFDDAGRPIDGGKERFQGAEYEGRFTLCKDLKLTGTYAYHDSRFVSLKLDATTDVSGKRLELSPYQLAGLGLQYLPRQGLNASVIANYAGERKLNKRNTAHAGGYTTVDASLGWQFQRVGFNVNGYNLTDRRVPISESELANVVSGASSYYLLPARLVTASVNFRF